MLCNQNCPAAVEELSSVQVVTVSILGLAAPPTGLHSGSSGRWSHSSGLGVICSSVSMFGGSACMI